MLTFFFPASPFFLLAAPQVIAHKSSTSDIMELRKVFDQYDTANNGIISFEEFQAALKEAKYPESQVKTIFDSIVSKRNFRRDMRTTTMRRSQNSF